MRLVLTEREAITLAVCINICLAGDNETGGELLKTAEGSFNAHSGDAPIKLLGRERLTELADLLLEAPEDRGYCGAFRPDLPLIVKLYREGKTPMEISAAVKPARGYGLTPEMVRYILKRELGVAFTALKQRRAKATPERTARMAELINGGATVREVAASFGLSSSRVSQLVCGAVYRMKKARGEPTPSSWSTKECAKALKEARP